MSMNQKGFVSIVLVIIIVLFVVLGYFVFVKKSELGGGESGIFGTVLVGPQCPSVGPGMEEQCADKPYQTTLVVMTSDRKKEIERFASNAAGEFRVVVTPGDYIIASLPGGDFIPRCAEVVKVEANKFTKAGVNCDTGIR